MPESGDTLDLVKIRFAELAAVIESLFRRDESFRILCQDYGDCIGTLVRLKGDDSTIGLARKTEYAELRDELEGEIRDWLARSEVDRTPW